MSERTKGEWWYDGNEFIFSNNTADGEVIAEMLPGSQWHTDAEFICKAVNNHDELVEALADIIRGFEGDTLESYQIERINKGKELLEKLR